MAAPLGRDTTRNAAWMSSVGLALFIFVMQFSTYIDSNGANTARFAKIFPFVLLIYVWIGFEETITRDFSDQRGFVRDNMFAMIAVGTGVGIFIWWIASKANSGSYWLTFDQSIIIGQSTFAALLDLYFGVVAANRIAGSGKERREE